LRRRRLLIAPHIPSLGLVKPLAQLSQAFGFLSSHAPHLPYRQKTRQKAGLRGSQEGGRNI